MCFNSVMSTDDISNTPTQCPVCNADLLVTRLECSACGTEVNGTFTLGHLAGLREPHASVIEMFLRLRGNVKDMERELGLSYPTVRARLEEALEAAGYEKEPSRGDPGRWEERFEADLADRIQRQVESHLGHLGRYSRQAERVSERAAHEAARAQERAERARERAEHARVRADEMESERKEILDKLDRGEVSADEAAKRLRTLRTRRS